MLKVTIDDSGQFIEQKENLFSVCSSALQKCFTNIKINQMNILPSKNIKALDQNITYYISLLC